MKYFLIIINVEAIDHYDADHARTHITYKCTYIICVHVHVARARHAHAHITYKCACIMTVYGT